MESKVLFITGGNGAIGSSIIKEFKGYKIVAPTSTEMDCSDHTSIKKFIEKEDLSKIDVFIHCAGINNIRSFSESTDNSILETLKINTLSFLYLNQLLNPYYVSGVTKILAVSSIYGTITRKGRLEYTTSKYALNGMVKTLALELAPKGIIVNSLAPGFILTKLTFKNNSKEVIQKIVENIPLGRMATTKDIAWYARMLCSIKNNYLTGQNIIVDGGYIIGGFQE